MNHYPNISADNTTIRYRYNASGNRVEKSVEKEGETSLTRYVRDASGNVMAVYKGEAQAEWHLYGSSRLGMGRGKAQSGQLKLGLRSYELSNHLGNVLAVITDNVNMTPDAANSHWYDSKAWTTVLNTADYYPFGLEMEGRTSTVDAEYRYGFNVKEKDTDFANHYDYGFRIYNPKIAKFLSVDPLAASFAWNSPFSYAENNVIRSVDLDGLEKVYYTSEYLKYKMALNLVISQDVELLSIWSEARKPERAEQFDVYFTTHGSDTKEAQGFVGNIGERVKSMSNVEKLTAYDKIRLGESKYNKLLEQYNETKNMLQDLSIDRSNVEKSLSEGKEVYVVSLNRDFASTIYNNDGTFNFQSLSERTFELMHEIDLHLRDNLNRNNTDYISQHKKWYKIDESSEFYKKYGYFIEAGLSPRRDQLSNDSRSKEISDKIDDVIKLLENK